MNLKLNQEAISELTSLIEELQILESERSKIIKENQQINAERGIYPLGKIKGLEECSTIAIRDNDYDAFMQFTKEIEDIKNLYKPILSPPELYPNEISLVISDFFYRVFGKKDTKYLEYKDLSSNLSRIDFLRGVVRLLKENRIPFREIAAAEIFSDFLEMAEHLLEENFKDPAAVLVGGVLEEHLRKLCVKNSLPLEFINTKGDVKPKKADTLNSDLMTAGIFTKLDQKSVTAWLDLRNKAAHSLYSEYTKEQVALFLQSVRDFITRYPA